VYRMHGENLFAGGGAAANNRKQELRLRTRRALVAGMKHRLTERGYDLSSADLNAYFKQWDLVQEKDEFVETPPGRITISRHLMANARYYGPQLSRRHRTYLNAAGSLVVGYKNVHRLDEWRLAIKRC
jgi:hypothetical protein